MEKKMPQFINLNALKNRPNFLNAKYIIYYFSFWFWGKMWPEHLWDSLWSLCLSKSIRQQFSQSGGGFPCWLGS